MLKRCNNAQQTTHSFVVPTRMAWTGLLSVLQKPKMVLQLKELSVSSLLKNLVKTFLSKTVDAAIKKVVEKRHQSFVPMT